MTASGAVLTRRSISKIDACPPVQSKPSDDRRLSSALGARLFATTGTKPSVSRGTFGDGWRCRLAIPAERRPQQRLNGSVDLDRLTWIS
jgi:hypothetical protein